MHIVCKYVFFFYTATVIFFLLWQGAVWQLTGWQLSSELRDVWTMSDNYSYLSKSVTSVQSRVLCKIPCFFVLLSVIWNVSNVSVSLSMLLSSLTTVSWWHLPWLRATLHDDTMCSMFPLLCTTLIVVCFVFNISTVIYGLGQYNSESFIQHYVEYTYMRPAVTGRTKERIT